MEQVDSGEPLQSEDDKVAVAVKARSPNEQPQLPVAAPPIHRPADANRFRDESVLLELDPFAPPGALLAARTRRAVRYGTDVYLPSWPEAAVGLPTALLQSSLWTAGDPVSTWMTDARLASLSDDVAVYLTGQQLTQYDRRVFAACLNHYRLDRPLTPRGIELVIGRTFFELARAMGLAYTRNTHVAIRNSLLRLKSASLRIRTRSLDLSIERLLEVALDDDYQCRPDTELKGSDQFGFRVPEEFAQLYGLGTWTLVPKFALESKGLRGWLVAFYATYNKPMLLPFRTLHALSGLACRPNDFRARLCAALEELQDQEVSQDVRLGRHAVSEDGTSITVWKAGW